MFLLEVNSAFASTSSVFKGIFRGVKNGTSTFFSFFLHYTLLQSVVHVTVTNND